MPEEHYSDARLRQEMRWAVGQLIFWWASAFAAGLVCALGAIVIIQRGGGDVAAGFLIVGGVGVIASVTLAVGALIEYLGLRRTGGQG